MVGRAAQTERLPPTTSNEAAGSAFAEDCIAGLSRACKSLPCKWLYDGAGSQLFERITALEEYYPSRAEMRLLEQASINAAELLGNPVSLVELGSGASRKTRLLLAAVKTIDTYIPIDISGEELDRAQAALRMDFPRLAIIPICADFTDASSLDLRGLRGPVLIFFPGSTLGNMAPQQATAFLRGLLDRIDPETTLLLGVDLLKDVDTMLAAYDDVEGVTAAFNLNLLERMRRELNAVVDVSNFRHRAIWNAVDQRIEMHLEARLRQVITLFDQRFVVDVGETIHTENSYKFSVDQWHTTFEAAGWRIAADWRSPTPQFLLTLLATPCR